MKKFLCLMFALLLCAVSALAEAPLGLTDFTATDMQGNEVTQAIFADHDLTAVNIWATWCGYCVEEMPEFPQLIERLPENVNFVTLCTDAAAEPELAAQILEASNANFVTIVDNEETYAQFTSLITAFPTTCFFNSEGVMVGQPIVGVPSLDDPVGAYYDLIMDALAQLEAQA